MKNLFYELTIKSVRNNRIRMTTTLVGVVISVALITNIIFTASSLYNFMIDDIKNRFGDWSIQIENMEGKVDEMAMRENLQQGHMSGISYAYIDGSVNPDKPFLYVVSLDERMKKLTNLSIKEGRMPRKVNEIAIPEHVITNAGVHIKVGDKLQIDEGYRINIVNGEELTQKDHYASQDEVFIKDREKTYKVVGICQRLAVEPYMAAGYTAITVPQKSVVNVVDTFFESSEYTQVQHILSKYYAKPETVKMNETLLKAQGLMDGDSSVGDLVVLSLLLVLFISICGFLLMYNTFTFSLREHEKSYRILASAGATKRQLRKASIYEGLFIGFIGITVGMIVGSVVTHILIGFFGDNILSMFTMYGIGKLNYQVGGKWIIMALGISISMVLLSIIFPAYRTGQIKPIRSYHYDDISMVSRRKLARINIFKQGILSLESKLALKNYRKNSKTYRYPVVSMTLSIVLFLSVGTVGSYMEKMLDFIEGPDVSYDISYVTKSANEAEKAFVHLSTVEGVERSVHYKFTEVNMDVGDENKDAIFYIMDDDSFRDYLNMNNLKSDGYFDEKHPRSLAMSYVMEFDNKSHSFKKDMLPEDEKLTGAVGKIPGIKGPIVIRDYIDNVPENNMLEIGRFVVLMSKSAAQGLTIDESKVVFSGTAYFTAKDNGKTYSTMEKICEKNGLGVDYLINLERQRDDIRSTMIVIEYFSYAFIILISIIAVVNVFNTINSDFSMRRMEFATLRSIGMSIKSLDKMICMECMMLGFRTLLYALPLTEIVLYIMYKRSKLNDIIGYIFPWTSTILSILVLIITIIAIMIYATYKIHQGDSSRALKNWK